MDPERGPPMHIWDERQAYEELLYWDSLIQDGHRLLPHDFDRYAMTKVYCRQPISIPTAGNYSAILYVQITPKLEMRRAQIPK